MSSENEMLPDVIGKLLKTPGIKVDRNAFLAKTYSNCTPEQLTTIIKDGPQLIFSEEDLISTSKHIVISDTEKSTAASFAAGLPSNLAIMIGAGTADVVQYYAFALRMAQKIAYVFGQPSIFNSDGSVTEEGERDIMLYLGAMFGIAAANSGIMVVSKGLGNTAAKKLMKTAVTKTMWYPLIKKIGSAIGIKITKQTTAKTLTKAVPLLGGIVSGTLTFVTFRPMGLKLIKTFVHSLNASEEQIKQAQNVIVQDL